MNRARRMLTELVEDTCEEIGFEFDEGCVEAVETLLFLNHGIKLSDQKVVTYNLIDKFEEELENWKSATEDNYM